MAQTASADGPSPQQRRLGTRIRALREEKGWSQDTFAHLTGLNRSYPHKIEIGAVDVRFSTLLRMAQALGITVCELVQDV